MDLNIPIPEEDLETDPEAESEAELAASGVYGRAAQRDAYRRTRDLYNAVANTGRILLFVAQTGILAVGLTLVLHYIFPESWTWVPPDRIAKIESFITGGILTAITLLVREYLNPRT